MTDVQILGDYLLIEQIGSGGMARTYRAISTQASTHVCLKILHPHLAAEERQLQMFLDEAHLLADLQHPHIVHLLDYGCCDERHYIALELILGLDLKTALQRAEEQQRHLPTHSAVALICALLSALACAHSLTRHGKHLQLIHRDVTPHNVLLGFDGAIKLTDFGVAKANARLAHTETGAIKGKVGYMAPEQLRDVPLDARVDLFAAGILLHELLTRQHLFLADTPYATLGNLVTHVVPPPSHACPDADPELDRITLRALERDPDQRYPTADAMLLDLERWRHQHPAPHNTPSVGAWLRDLCDIEPEEDERPRRFSSQELTLWAPPQSDADDHTDVTSLDDLLQVPQRETVALSPEEITASLLADLRRPS